MANVVIIGMQWGDEGKGKIVDLICPAFDAVVRYQGGHNAGHTVRFGEEHFSLHLIPSGILHPEMQCALGNGMVIEPEAFFTELTKLEAAGVEARDRLFLSTRAHLVMPFDPVLDQAREKARGQDAIGTTSRGIGPAYEAKASRYGFRLCDLASSSLEDRLRAQLLRVEAELQSLGAGSLEHPGRLADRCRRWKEQLAPFLKDTEWLLHQWIADGKSLLLEGAQGTMLDLDHGTFPFVTSSNSTAGGACTGTGLPPTALDGALGVLKAYTTRVGAGPFATEMEGPREEALRKRGNEYGTTTGRPRRCGWLDLVVARYSQRVNGIGAIALTKLDVLDDLEEIPVCIGYRRRGTLFRDHSTSFEGCSDEPFEPVYKTLKGWRKTTVGTLTFEDLPQEARDYVDFLEQEIEAPVALVSTGPRREETILRRTPDLTGWLGDRREAVEAQLSA